MRENRERFVAVGADLAAVGTASPHQAQAMQADAGFPLLVDPDFAFRDAIAVTDKLSIRELMKRDSAVNYGSAIKRGSRQGWATPTHVRNRPAVVIRSPDGALAWAHEGAALGDYPSIDVVLAALVEVMGPAQN
ncbi:MAG: hypothetical protein ACR2QE_21495 [Acidimicrobiales bacterium]